MKSKNILASIFTTFSIAGCAMQSMATQWDTVSNMLEGRQEIYAASAGGVVYIPGGVRNDGTTSASLDAYFAEENRWKQLAPLPEARHHITPAIVENKLYAVGGFSGSFPDWVMEDEVFVYDIDAGKWNQGRALPSPQGEHIAAVVDGKIHVIGGRTPSATGGSHFDAYVDTKLHYIYDPESNEWTISNPAPTARNSAAAAVLDGLIYVVGGRENKRQADGSQLQHNVGTLEVYNPKKDTWQTLSPMPEGLGGNAASVLNGEIYVFGGEQWTPEHKVFSSAWVYSPKSDAWRKTENMPTARHGLASAAIGERIYTFGGCIKTGGGAVVAATEVISP